MKKRHPKRLLSSSANNNALINQLYDFGEPEKPQAYQVRLTCELSYPERPIPGLLKIDPYCFEATVDMVEYSQRLKDAIEKWKMMHDNNVTVTIHHAKCPKSNELAVYVQLHPSKRWLGYPCLEREYDALRKFIRSLPDYQLAP